MADTFYTPLGIPEIDGVVPTPQAGFVRLYARAPGAMYLKKSDGIETPLVSESTITVIEGAINTIQAALSRFREFVSATTLTNNSTVSLVNVSDLAASVEAGKRYEIECYLLYQTTAANRGIGITLGSVGGAAGSIVGKTAVMTSSAGTNAEYVGSLLALGSILQSPGAESANTTFLAKIDCVFTCSTSGSLVPQFLSEGGGETMTVQAGSILMIREFEP